MVLRLPLDDWREQRDPADDGNRHLYTWTPRLIANLLREAGFQVERAEVVTYAWPPRSAELVDRLPRRVFDLLARVTAIALRRRQVLVVAVPQGFWRNWTVPPETPRGPWRMSSDAPVFRDRPRPAFVATNHAARPTTRNIPQTPRAGCGGNAAAAERQT